MTQQEKAEKYAEGYRCPATNEMEYCRHDITSAYNNGYTQCQEDMAIEIAELKIICQEYSIDVKTLNDMLNSLNKQD